MKDDGDGCFTFMMLVSAVLSIASVVLSLTVVSRDDYWHGQAIDHGFAIYDVDTQTGDAQWRWKTPEEVCAAKEEE